MNPKLILLLIIIIPLLGAFIGFILGRIKEKIRDLFNIFITGVILALVTYLYPIVSYETINLSISDIMGVGLHLKLDMFRYIFVWLTCFIWFLVTIYSTQYLVSYKNRNRYYLFFMLTLWSTIGVFISEDLINLFTFFEIMSLASYPLIIHDEDAYSHEAGQTYLIMAVTGGLVLLMGLFLLYDYTQTLRISELKVALLNIGWIKYVITSLIIFGFGVKAGMVPLHIWLPKAHPAAPAPASAILSGILLKTGIFGILITSQLIVSEDEKVAIVILILGFITMVSGGFLAMFQRNIKRILAYSSMSQMGYIIVGIGLMGILKEHKAIALYGTLYHIINHVFFKVLLFMLAGIIYMVLHELSINSIGGFGKGRKLITVMFFIGFCAIIGMPGFNGFISKNLLHHALTEAMIVYPIYWRIICESIFTLSGAFTTAYLLKIFIAVFMEDNNDADRKIKTNITNIAIFPIIILSILIIFIGIKPSFIIDILDMAVTTFNVSGGLDVKFYTLSNIKSSFVSIIIGTLIYTFFIRKVLRKEKDNKWWYENIALNWFSVERNVYSPTINFIFKISSVILKLCDEGLIHMINFINNSFASLGEIQLEFRKNIKKKVPKKVINISDIKRSSVNFDKTLVKKTINDEIDKMGYKMNSITYSIYIFAIVLAIFLVVLLGI
ncbi:complex I subunit 5 family protein [Clostridium rectalis]|uniref:complex I subunit 5 family protein n=1 Tax=Clostridium rectalis TaxID=2040295 RepID=UPI0013DE6445|nr:complex I subunit 5 family protein [Clostridium rectalis]